MKDFRLALAPLRGGDSRVERRLPPHSSPRFAGTLVGAFRRFAARSLGGQR